MTPSIAHAPWLHWPETESLIAAFEASGMELRFVGGCVRDALLERPVQDLDACTPLRPDAVMGMLAKAGIKAIPTGIDHGTVTAIIGNRAIEITTLRRDDATDGRHAQVTYTTSWEEDAKRRDFTINALYADGKGAVSDYSGGLSDLEARLLRFIGDAHARVREDYLRILRYYRFLAQLGWGADHIESREACRSHRSGMALLSGERVGQEMRKLLSALHVKEALLQIMREDGVWQAIGAPETAVSLDTLLEAERMLELPPCAMRRLAYMCRHANTDLHALAERWKLSNAERARLRSLCSLPLQLDKPTLRHTGAEVFLDLLALAMAEQAIPRADARKWAEAARTWIPPLFPVRGNDLLAMGYTAGPELGRALTMLETQWEEEEYLPTKEALLGRLTRPLK